MIYNQADLVLIPFPFSDLTGIKKRPALVLSKSDVQKETNHVICMMISSVKGSTPFDVNIENWEESGLLKPSIARANKVFTIDAPVVLKKMGVLNQEEFQNILDVFLKLFKETNQEMVEVEPFENN